MRRLGLQRGGAAWGLWLEETGGGPPGRGSPSSGRAQSGAASRSRRGAGSRASTPHPRRDVSGATLKGAGRPPRVGAVGLGPRARMGAPRLCWGESGEPQHPARPSLGNPGSLRGRGRHRSPRGSPAALEPSPSRRRDRSTPFRGPVPIQELQFPSVLAAEAAPGGRACHRVCWEVWSIGTVPSTPLTRKWVKERGPQGASVRPSPHVADP